mmetsp:Transcript_18826/g.18489  ORF Transcript_18826/g.18489 Transcript_18826/m.18489 type:complete len:84 (+) Transcript_18826:520-771(+)
MLQSFQKSHSHNRLANLEPQASIHKKAQNSLEMSGVYLKHLNSLKKSFSKSYIPKIGNFEQVDQKGQKKMKKRFLEKIDHIKQ